jgi:hypothetical protein
MRVRGIASMTARNRRIACAGSPRKTMGAI